MGVTTNHNQTGRQFQYVPTLRTKAGEITALENLPPQTKMRIVPVFQMMPTVSAVFAADLTAAWPGLPIILDGTPQVNATGSTAGFSTMFSVLGNAGIPLIPLVDVGAQPPYAAAVAQSRNQFAPGMALRVGLAHLQTAQNWLLQFGGNPAETDLLVDCGHVADIDPLLLLPMVSLAITNNAATLANWRSVTLTSSAAPKDASSLQAGANLIPRRDWNLWSALSASWPQLHYGDFGITHRDLTEPPGIAMANATVTPRYALSDEWLIRKGVSTRGVNGQPMAAQYHGHAQALAANANFGQVPGCWADGRIAAIASSQGSGSSGNRESWVAFGLNRHLNLTCRNLA